MVFSFHLPQIELKNSPKKTVRWSTEVENQLIRKSRFAENSMQKKKDSCLELCPINVATIILVNIFKPPQFPNRKKNGRRKQVRKKDEFEFIQIEVEEKNRYFFTEAFFKVMKRIS